MDNFTNKRPNKAMYFEIDISRLYIFIQEMNNREKLAFLQNRLIYILS